jgi:hypothetical protein
MLIYIIWPDQPTGRADSKINKLWTPAVLFAKLATLIFGLTRP